MIPAMKTSLFFKLWSMVFGIVITLIWILMLLPKIIGNIWEEGFSFLKTFFEGWGEWSDPTNFFITYVIGYALTWWKPLSGSLVLIACSIYYVAVAGIWGPSIFAIPTFLVGLFYLIAWFLARKHDPGSLRDYRAL